MFRPNTAATDLNEFPVLGTPPPTMNRASAVPNRLASYASTAGNGFQEPLETSDFNKLSSFSNRNNFNGVAPSADQLSSRNLAPRSFSMDEFPALRSAVSPFDNSIGRESGKPEQWLDYANLREQQQQQQQQQQPGGKPFPEKNELSDSWARKQDELSSDGKPADPYGLLGLLGVIRMTDPDRSMLALGSDLTTLGLDLNTAE
ncbi:hypothetical protein CU097_005681 [Rhizopus azygosporus]|uniref:Uncharacterized protein n=1 Tax=Rhizopus azygosporus TaxID=86630 RepID=A0A367IVR0_RHIAZ|nr:hypothetical protein CU097_005681 [Rhizopus azygosporus]